MSTASITHYPLPVATAAMAAVAVLAFAGLTVLQDDSSSVPVQRSTSVDNFRKHAGRLPATAHMVG